MAEVVRRRRRVPPSSGVDRPRDFLAEVTVEGTGAVPFRWEGHQTVHLIRVGRPGMDVNLLSASVELTEQLPEDRAARFRWGFDLFNVYADRPGTFTFDGTESAAVKSGVLFVWMRVKDASKEAVFDESELEYLENFTQLRNPCTVEVGEGERTGALRCPEVANEDGEVAGFEVRWQETGPEGESS